MKLILTTHNYKMRGPDSSGTKCKLEIYESENSGPSVVVVTEIDSNPGMAITNCAEELAAQVFLRTLPHPERGMIWIENNGIIEFGRFDLGTQTFIDPQWRSFSEDGLKELLEMDSLEWLLNRR